MSDEEYGWYHYVPDDVKFVLDHLDEVRDKYEIYVAAQSNLDDALGELDRTSQKYMNWDVFTDTDDSDDSDESKQKARLALAMYRISDMIVRGRWPSEWDKMDDLDKWLKEASSINKALGHKL